MGKNVVMWNISLYNRKERNRRMQRQGGRKRKKGRIAL